MGSICIEKKRLLCRSSVEVPDISRGLTSGVLEVPHSVNDAPTIDKKHRNTFWVDTIAKEMKNVRVAFKILEDNEKPQPGFQFIRCHMIFDIKMEDFRRKAWLVAGGHMTDVPRTITYSSVVGCDTVQIAITLAALNDLEVKVANIMNAYVTAPTQEKIWIILGPKFGDDQGKNAVIVHALYGLKSAGASI